jgi:formylglycine-generating enzyme required for sulfatase activity
VGRAIAVALVVGAIGGALGIALARRGRDEGARCGPGFYPEGPRCVVRAGTCPSPLEPSAAGCGAPDVRILVPAAVVQVGPADWEATGSVSERTIRTGAFYIDAFEVTRKRWEGAGPGGDSARAANGMTRDEAAAFCAHLGGRLPTEDEWLVAASSGTGNAGRYAWGDTGAVCRRAAWGLYAGPCGTSGDGPDTVGAHGDGDSPLGLHDMAGNVAEWVSPEGSGRPGVAKGGSWQSALASDLRVWARLELAPSATDSRVGVRCAYPP